jgi:hypothetical protein
MEEAAAVEADYVGGAMGRGAAVRAAMEKAVEVAGSEREGMSEVVAVVTVVAALVMKPAMAGVLTAMAGVAMAAMAAVATGWVEVGLAVMAVVMVDLETAVVVAMVRVVVAGNLA